MPAPRIVLKRGDGNVEAVVEHLSDGLIAVPPSRFEGYLGRVYYLHDVCTATGNACLALKTGPDTYDYHLDWNVWSKVGGEIYLQEAPTLSATGTPLILVPNNRVLSVTAASSVWGKPTLSATGSVLSHAYVDAGKPLIQVGDVLGADFWLAPDTLYVFTMQSPTTDTVSWWLTLTETPRED